MRTSSDWRADRNGGCKRIRARTGPRQLVEIANTVGLRDDEEDLSNALVMAAGPDLLDVCERLGRWGQGVPKELMEDCRAAVKKAGGREW